MWEWRHKRTSLLFWTVPRASSNPRKRIWRWSWSCCSWVRRWVLLCGQSLGRCNPEGKGTKYCTVKHCNDLVKTMMNLTKRLTIKCARSNFDLSKIGYSRFFIKFDSFGITIRQSPESQFLKPLSRRPRFREVRLRIPTRWRYSFRRLRRRQQTTLNRLNIPRF